MSKLFRNLLPQVRQRQQRGRDRLPAKAPTKALGLYGEDMTEELRWCLRQAREDPARAWDYYKSTVQRHTRQVTNRIGEPPPPRVSIDDTEPTLTKWAIMPPVGRVAQVWVTDLPKAECEKYWPGYTLVPFDELPEEVKATYAVQHGELLR